MRLMSLWRLVCVLAWVYGAGGAAAAPLQVLDYAVPQRVTPVGAEFELGLRGHAAVERRMFSWYTAILHADVRLRKPEQLVRGLEPCRITLVWQENDASAAQVREHFLDLYQRSSTYTAQEELNSRITGFLGGLPAAKRGQVWYFDYSPEAGMLMYIDGQMHQRLSGIDFARAMLGLWLGEGADPGIRAHLFWSPEKR